MFRGLRMTVDLSQVLEQVRYGAILQDGSAKTKCLGQHRGHSHKMAIEPGSSRIIYSCGEDGVVQHVRLLFSYSSSCVRNIEIATIFCSLEGTHCNHQ